MSIVKEHKYHSHKPRVGCRPPEGYKCIIPCRVKSPVVLKAIRKVLQVLEEDFFEDALRLEQKIRLICPMWRRVDVWGEYKRYKYDDWQEKQGVLGIREDLDYDLACVVFAHECGHVVDRGDIARDRHPSLLPSKYFREAGANLYVQRWGFGALVDKVNKRENVEFITPEILQKASQESDPPYVRFRDAVIEEWTYDEVY